MFYDPSCAPETRPSGPPYCTASQAMASSKFRLCESHPVVLLRCARRTFVKVRVGAKINVFLHFKQDIKHIGEGNGNPLQDSCLENHMDRRAWLAIVHGVSRPQTRLNRKAHGC